MFQIKTQTTFYNYETKRHYFTGARSWFYRGHKSSILSRCVMWHLMSILINLILIALKNKQSLVGCNGKVVMIVCEDTNRER